MCGSPMLPAQQMSAGLHDRYLAGAAGKAWRKRACGPASREHPKSGTSMVSKGSSGISSRACGEKNAGELIPPWHNLEPPCPLGHQSLRPVIAVHRLLPVSVLCTSPGLCRENGECGWDDWWPVWLPAPALCRKPGHTLLAPLSTLPPASLPLLSGWPEI